jgi:hypothetical protein
MTISRNRGRFYSDTIEAVAAWLDGKPIRVANPEALPRGGPRA